ncbi:uncharacterized protein LOC122498868 [Leptopilina heterotoma]|uniref:uncharacterized protein LOC122498868 n=1 Tax=Leptopilina heterotoma TaxID=63436 RepID=UPI001CA83860|nr:uncharacterized protein LOC122498868 [Leptopilina heterotoma]
MKIAFLFLLSLLCICESSNNNLNLSQCLMCLKAFLKTELNTFHQVMIFTNNTEKVNNEEILSLLMSKTSVLQVDFRNSTEELLIHSKMIRMVKEPELTTLFVIVNYIETSEDVTKLTKAINLIKSASYKNGHPTCLFLLYSKQRDLRFEKFLTTMWNKKFLDVTILHIVAENEDKTKNSLLSNEQFFANVHQFNPYLKKTTYKNCSTSVEMFSDKLHNLNGYKIKFGTYNQPFTNYVKMNATGYPVEMRGFVISYARLLSQVMNFKLAFVPSNEKAFGTFDCYNKSRTTGYFNQLAYNKIQIAAFNSLLLRNCEYSYVILGRIEIIVLVPIIMENDKEIEGKLLFSLTTPMILIILLSVWIITRILKFDRHNWKLMYIIQMILQLCAPREPRKLRERLIYCYLLIVSTVISSNLFGALTGLKFSNEKELIFDTIRDVHESYLQPIGFLGINRVGNTFADNEIKREFTKKHIGFVDFVDICAQHIVKYRNISCTMQNNEAEIIIRNTRNENGKPQTKIVKESMSTT